MSLNKSLPDPNPRALVCGRRIKHKSGRMFVIYVTYFLFCQTENGCYDLWLIPKAGGNTAANVPGLNNYRRCAYIYIYIHLLGIFNVVVCQAQDNGVFTGRNIDKLSLLITTTASASKIWQLARDNLPTDKPFLIRILTLLLKKSAEELIWHCETTKREVSLIAEMSAR